MPSRSDRSMSPRVERLSALFLATAAQLALLLLLRQVADKAPGNGGNDEARVSLVFIERPLARAPVPAVMPGALGRPGRVAGSSPPVASAAPRRPALDVLDEGHGPAMAVAHAPLDLAIRPDDISFKRAPLTRPAQAAFPAREPTLQVRVEDNSWMGRYARMGRRMACAELRQALASNPDSAEAIIRTMEQRNCIN